MVAGVYEGKDDIAARVQFNGVGIDLKTETPKADQIRRAVATVLSDHKYRRQAQQLSEEFKSYPANQIASRYIGELV